MSAPALLTQLLTYPDPESHRNGAAIQEMLCKYADVDQVNAALRQIDTILGQFQGDFSQLQNAVANLSGGLPAGVESVDGGSF